MNKFIIYQETTPTGQIHIKAHLDGDPSKIFEMHETGLPPMDKELIKEKTIVNFGVTAQRIARHYLNNSE